MTTGYFDCFSGAAGDMILGALISAGLDPNQLRADLNRLKLDGYTLDVHSIKKQGFAATKVNVRVNTQQTHRHLHTITKIIDTADLPSRVKQRSIDIFTRLAEAEARVHGVAIEKVHFHEVGAIDAIVDVVGSAIGFERLEIDRIVCSPIPVGSGTVQCEHGVIPVPAPATAELLIGVPLADCNESGELVTPTGAAILTTLAEGYGPVPAMRIERIGCGAGDRDGHTRPNILRFIVGQSEVSGDLHDGDLHDTVVCLEANLDDSTGEQIGHACERLYAAGALEVYTIPITMKKSRPGVLLSVLAPTEMEAACEEIIFSETTTFGLRRHVCSRRKLVRRIETVTTKFGTIRIKLGFHHQNVIRLAPEYDDCAQAARKQGVPLHNVMDAARQAWNAQQGSRT